MLDLFSIYLSGKALLLHLLLDALHLYIFDLLTRSHESNGNDESGKLIYTIETLPQASIEWVLCSSRNTWGISLPGIPGVWREKEYR